MLAGHMRLDRRNPRPRKTERDSAAQSHEQRDLAAVGNASIAPGTMIVGNRISSSAQDTLSLVCSGPVAFTHSMSEVPIYKNFS
jgi:hypothetical protein